MIWHPYTPRTTYGVSHGGIVATVHRHGGVYLWALTDRRYDDEGVEATEEEARGKAEAAYRARVGMGVAA